MFKLSPSDFAFLWEDCKHCFYLKSTKGIRQPSIPLPGIFSKIDSLLKNYAAVRNTNEIHHQLASGRMDFGGKWVTSQPIQSRDGKYSCYIKGAVDSIACFDDGTYGVIDFKTSNPSNDKSVLYGRQLHAYTYALENPAEGSLSLKPITKVGLLYFYPTSVEHKGKDSVNYFSNVEWVEIPKNEDNFLVYIEKVLSLLSSPIPLAQTCDRCEHCKTGLTCRPSKPCEACPCTCCQWCNYREGFASGRILETASSEEILCPQCSGPMAERSGKFGKFWGCTKYPECKGTRKMEQ